MHRHSYKGRKLQREAAPRKALIRGQMTSLVLHEAITTTEAKAKEVAPQFERLVTHAKKNSLAGSRALRRELLTENATQKMIQELAGVFANRHGGYTRIIKLGNRRGDNAPMARLALVLDDREALAAATASTAPTNVTAKLPANAKTSNAKPTEKSPAKASAKSATKPTAKPKAPAKPEATS